MQIFQLKYFKFIITNNFQILILNGNTHYKMHQSIYMFSSEMHTQQHNTGYALVIDKSYVYKLPGRAKK